MADRWSAEQVDALAPDASSLSAARALAIPTTWRATGFTEDEPRTVWGLCQGSGRTPYQTGVDLVEPAFKCSCPSRKIPCKHALALLLLWATDRVPPGLAPDWVHEWQAARESRQAGRAARAVDPARIEANEKAAARRAEQRADRVEGGLAELDQWLDDQIRAGLAGLDQADYHHWDRMAARLVDAQAGTVAGAVRRLAAVPGASPDWTGRMLADLAALRLLTTGYGRAGRLPEPLVATIRSRIGFPVTLESVRAGRPHRDRWQILASRDEVDEQLVSRRIWLLGRDSGQPALVLAFAPPGGALPADLVVGTAVEADLFFYPGAASLRAVVGDRHGEPTAVRVPGPAHSVSGALQQFAAAVAADPWQRKWPVLIEATLVPGEDRWHLVDAMGDALPIRAGLMTPWRLHAAAGGAPAMYVAELGEDGLELLAGFVAGEVIRE